MHPSHITRSFRSLLCVAATLAVASAPLDAQSASESPTAPILSVMERLESARDAKCYSSACRFENYVFGTPLSEAGREERVELQTEFVWHVWGAASRRLGDAEPAAGALASAVTEEVGRVFRVESGLLGEMRVTFGEREVVLSQLRKNQYSSIAYSLRAILTVQQEYLLEGGSRLLELDDASIDVLREAVDTVTLCALLVADETARATSAAEIDAALLRAAWRELIAEPGEVDGAADVVVPTAEMRAHAGRVLDAIIDEKLAAYGAYNNLSELDVQQRFGVNIERFYALANMPPNKDELVAFFSSYDNAMRSFSLQLLKMAAASAQEANRSLIRSADAAAAVQLLTPHEVNDLEDVQFFPRLSPAQRVSLEAYDCDSYRDLGKHWTYIDAALEASDAPALAPDPFAAEILAEGVSQYGVLLLRVAGGLSRERLETNSLIEPDVRRAAQKIYRLSAANAEAADSNRKVRGIVSATRTRRAKEGALFRDDTRASGIGFTHRSSQWLSELRRTRLEGPPTFSGGGVAADDIDGDGDDDLLFVGGIGNALYRNDGGTFVAVTTAGINAQRDDGSFCEARTPLIADFDNDGHADLLITYAGDDHRIYRGLGEWRFEDVTARAKFGGAEAIGGPATVFDYDGDGLLDVYLAYFGDYRTGAVPTVDRDNQNAVANRLFRNKGDFEFEDVTAASGTGDLGWCQAVSHTDIDRDGRQDLIVANDFGRNAFLRNRGDGTFEDAAPGLGVDQAYHSMNVGITDLNADGHPDIYISNIATLVKDNKYVLPDVFTPMSMGYDAMARMIVKESDVLYMSRVDDGNLAAFVPSESIERGATSTGWAWDAEFLDCDNDGDDDLYVVNGTNDYNFYTTVNRVKREDGTVENHVLTHARESNVLFLNEGGKLRNISEGSGADLLMNSRSTAYLDADGDGDLDVVLNNFHSPAVLLRNELETTDGWLSIRLVGDPAQGANRDAIGAAITVTSADGLRVRREIQGGSGFLSMNPKACHFGTGAAEVVDAAIEWPNGSRQVVRGLAVGRAHTVRQSESD